MNDPTSERGSVRLRNHWKRPLGPLGYYWFLTFEASPELRSLVKHCQDSIDFPFYDPTPPDSLHLTIDRIAPVGEISTDQLDSTISSAIRACRGESAFELGIDQLSVVPSAVSLNVSPAHAVHHLRDTLRSATLSACPELQLGHPKPHPPHISIAYANSMAHQR
ncbi:2'-5' RNA ligase family protein [Nocardia sp. NPDC051750]|uniref:2'-5' RNA ligase family protein n=1 Tax=Nocardia sp. NPDC051750 TaxID=3364325 RepID=UPI0037A5E0BD